MSHFIFFDSHCPLCQKSIEQIEEIDVKKQFIYLPLASEKSQEMLPQKLLNEDSLVLLENGKKVWIRSKAAFRILHLIGGKWKWLGLLCYVPGLDLFYRLVAKNRHFFLNKK